MDKKLSLASKEKKIGNNPKKRGCYRKRIAWWKLKDKIDSRYKTEIPMYTIVTVFFAAQLYVVFRIT